MKFKTTFLSAAFISLAICGTAIAEDQKIEISAKDVTSEWVMMFDRGVASGKRLNSFCNENDYVVIDLNDEAFKVCRSFKAFMGTDQFKNSPDAFQLGFLTSIK